MSQRPEMGSSLSLGFSLFPITPPKASQKSRAREKVPIEEFHKEVPFTIYKSKQSIMNLPQKARIGTPIQRESHSKDIGVTSILSNGVGPQESTSGR